MMGLWTAFKGSKVVMYAVIAAAFAWGLLLLIGKLMAAGAAKEQATQMRREGELRSKADEAERMVDRAGDGELDELRKRWTRPQ